MDDGIDSIVQIDDQSAANAVLRGTRLRVGFILECLSNGMREEEIKVQFPEFNPTSLPGLFAYCAEKLASPAVQPDKKQKDRWDKAQIILPFVGSGILALVGIAFTASYQNANQQRDLNLKDNQTQIQKAQMIAQFMPYLTGKDEEAKKAAVRIIKEIGGVALAIEVVRSTPSDGTASALVAIATQSSNEADRKNASAAARQIFSDKINRALLLKGQTETPGFGRYSYLLIRSPARGGSEHDRYMAAVAEFVQRWDRLENSIQVGSKPSDLNVTYVPVVENPHDATSPQWILDHYDFARAQMILANIAGGSGIEGDGPFLLSTSSPATANRDASQRIVIQNLSGVPVGLVKAWIEEFFDQGDKQKNWTLYTTETLMNGIRSFLGSDSTKIPMLVSR